LVERFAFDQPTREEGREREFREDDERRAARGRSILCSVCSRGSAFCVGPIWAAAARRTRTKIASN
jgi:hypothetical protein